MLDPERLKLSNATKLERQLLAAAGGERPSAELTGRMRQAIGLSAAGAGATALAATKSTGLAWISAGIVAAAIAGGAVGVWTSYRRVVASRATPPAAAVTCAVSSPAPASPSLGPASPLPTRIASRQVRSHAAIAVPVASGRGDLREEIALVDEVRTALKEQAPRRALTLLRQYAATYPEGTFGPEAEALRVEALNENGQHRLAQSLARDFVIRHPDSPLAERVSRSIDDRL